MRRDTPETIAKALRIRAEANGDPRLIVTFPVPVPKNFTETEVKALLEQQVGRPEEVLASVDPEGEVVDSPDPVGAVHDDTKIV